MYKDILRFFSISKARRKASTAKLIYKCLPCQKLVHILGYTAFIKHGGWSTSQKYVQNPLVSLSHFWLLGVHFLSKLTFCRLVYCSGTENNGCCCLVAHCHHLTCIGPLKVLTMCCKCLHNLACLYCKIMPMFQRTGMREGGKPLPLTFQYLILMINKPYDLNLVIISLMASKCQDFKIGMPSFQPFYQIKNHKVFIS